MSFPKNWVIFRHLPTDKISTIYAKHIVFARCGSLVYRDTGLEYMPETARGCEVRQCERCDFEEEFL